MDKQQLLIRLLEITDAVKQKERMKHEKEKSSYEVKHKEEKDRDRNKDKEHRCRKEGHGEFKLPPAARKVLSVLLKEHKLNQRTIAKNTNITAQGISDVIKKLEKRELIIKESGDSYNENIITLTDKGEKIAKSIEENMKENAENLFENFSEEEMSTLSTLLEKIYYNSIAGK